MRQTPQRWFVEMIEMRVCQQYQVDGRKMFDRQPGTLEAFQQKQPVGEIGINENIQIMELNQERRVTNPGQRDLAWGQFREDRSLVISFAAREQNLPDHLIKKGARIEGLGRREIFERSGQARAQSARTMQMAMYGFHGTGLIPLNLYNRQ